MELPPNGTACQRPEIEYPCRWEYKTIGRSELRMREAVGRIMAAGEQAYTLEVSNSSRSGKFCSLLLAVTVTSEDHRNGIFAALSADEDILIVL